MNKSKELYALHIIHWLIASGIAVRKKFACDAYLIVDAERVIQFDSGYERKSLNIYQWLRENRLALPLHIGPWIVVKAGYISGLRSNKGLLIARAIPVKFQDADNNSSNSHSYQTEEYSDSSSGWDDVDVDDVYSMDDAEGYLEHLADKHFEEQNAEPDDHHELHIPVDENRILSLITRSLIVPVNVSSRNKVINRLSDMVNNPASDDILGSFVGEFDDFNSHHYAHEMFLKSTQNKRNKIYTANKQLGVYCNNSYFMSASDYIVKTYRKTNVYPFGAMHVTINGRVYFALTDEVLPLSCQFKKISNTV